MQGSLTAAYDGVAVTREDFGRSSPPANAAVVRGQVGVFGSSSCLDERHAQPLAAVTRSAETAFAG